jgi:hypothetical protein
VLLSVGDVFTRALSWIPGLGAERVATRLLLVPLALLPIFAADGATRLPARARPWLAVGVGALAVELGLLAARWRISALVGRLGPLPLPGPVPHSVAMPDPDLVTAAGLGALASLLALGWILAGAFRSRVR